MKKSSEEKTVFVGLSGGVDSSVAAARLLKQGYKVVGVFIKVWHPDWMVCNWEQERLDAMRVAAHLNIPFLTCDAEAAYRDEVAAYFIEEYKAGRTPNPDVMCNQHVKFGRFLEFAKEKGADYIATGHYAQKITTEHTDELHRGVDVGKDQTYFLWTLTSEQLAASLFPVGDTPKEEIRAEALTHNIPVATKKDSQGICFLGHVDIAEFLSHYCQLEPGNLLNSDGEVIGTHQGALVYTQGQRHGFTVTVQQAAQSALYVVGRDLATNTVTVAPHLQEITNTESITLSSIIVRGSLSVGDAVEYQIRYRQTPTIGTITSFEEEKITIQPEKPLATPATGQSCVLYRGSHCLGGGIIS